MKLYSLPLSPYSARVRGALYAKNLVAEVVAPPDGWPSSEAFRALNPLGRIPVLVLDDGTALCESGIIVEYLEEAHPEPPLLPRRPVDRARVRLVTQVAETLVMEAMMPAFLLFDAKERNETAIETQLAKLDAALGKLETMLQAKRYAFGDHLSIADVWLTPMRYSLDGLMSFSGRKGLLDRHPRVAGYSDVVQRDPALARVWQEMVDGLKAFMEKRLAQAKA